MLPGDFIISSVKGHLTHFLWPISRVAHSNSTTEFWTASRSASSSRAPAARVGEFWPHNFMDLFPHLITPAQVCFRQRHRSQRSIVRFPRCPSTPLVRRIRRNPHAHIKIPDDKKSSTFDARNMPFDASGRVIFEMALGRNSAALLPRRRGYPPLKNIPVTAKRARPRASFTATPNWTFRICKALSPRLFVERPRLQRER